MPPVNEMMEIITSLVSEMNSPDTKQPLLVIYNSDSHYSMVS